LPKKATKKEPKPKVAKEPKETRSLTERMRDELRKQFKDDGAATTLGGYGFSGIRAVMPTGIDVLDRWVIGIGGLPYGRIVEISGPEDVGKSSLVNHLMSAAQRDGAVACLGDSERKVQPAWAETFKVDRAAVLLLPADTIEQYLSEVAFTIKKFGKRNKIVFILDSIASSKPRKALDEDLQENEIPGAAAAAWSRGLRGLNTLLSESLSMLILINQLRNKIGVLYGPNVESTGGNAIKHYSSLRLSINHGAPLKDGTVRIGKWANIRANKNHLTSDLRKAAVLLNFGSGWDNDRSTLMFAKETGAVDSKCRSVKEARKNLDWSYDEAAPDVLIDNIAPKEKE
jgi:recombination protein RecA